MGNKTDRKESMDQEDPKKIGDEKRESRGSYGPHEHVDDQGQEPDSDPRMGGVAETLKKIISAGLGAAFMTEESIRSYLSEVRLPKDVLNVIIQGAGKSKEELLNRVGNEIVKIIGKIDFVNEASRFVEEHKFKINAEIEVVKKTKPSSKDL